jgi:hypothetical protein
MISLTQEDAQRVADRMKRYAIAFYGVGVVTGAGLMFCVLKAMQ